MDQLDNSRHKLNGKKIVEYIAGRLVVFKDFVGFLTGSGNGQRLMIDGQVSAVNLLVIN